MHTYTCLAHIQHQDIIDEQNIALQIGQITAHTHTYTRMHVHSQHGADITVFKCLSHDSLMHSWPAYIIKSDHIERKQPNIEM